MTHGDTCDIHIVHLDDDLLLVKRPDPDWRALQDEFADYKTSIGPMTAEAAVEYLDIEYGPDPERSARVIAFAAARETILRL